MIKCADCGFLGVRHLITQELVSPAEEQRQNGTPPESDNGRPNLDTEPVCAVGATVLWDDSEGDYGPAHLIQKERDCSRFSRWIPALSPKEHLDMDMLEQQRQWQQEQARLAEDRHRETMTQAKAINWWQVVMLGAFVGLCTLAAAFISRH